MGVLTDLLFRIAHAVRASPALQIAIGLGLLVAGALALFIGGGHGGLIVFGVMVLTGGITAIRGGNARAHHNPEHKDSSEESRNH
ncbi:MAG TPA: hypothetical protein VMU90_07015 [Solirubrobacteraceae bacterium]|nr:hypothetical protein [Solirubrobacteraceae bacterium]